MAFTIFCGHFQHFFFWSCMFFEQIDFQLGLTFVVLLSAFFTAILFCLFRCLQLQLLIFFSFGNNFTAIVNLQPFFFALCLFDQSQLDGPSILLADYYHIWFFHPGLCEIGHRWRIFILFVLCLPGLDHGVDLFLGRLDLVQYFGALIYCLYLYI